MTTINIPGKLVFLDTETTSLRPDRRAWEVALIVRDPAEDGSYTDEEHTWLVIRDDLDLGNADVRSLQIGRFYERHPEFNGSAVDDPWGPSKGVRLYTAESVALEVEKHTRGAVLVGAVPDFDADVLGQMLRREQFCPSWHYHLLDVETFAAGALRLPPRWNFDLLLAEYGLTYDEADRHTALGDTRMVRDLYDAVLRGAR